MMMQKIVIKLGGSALQNPETLRELSRLVAGYQKKNYAVVLVHGGGPAINQELVKRNITWQFVDGQRQTTTEMMGVIDQVLAKDVNGLVVNALQFAGIKARGLSGAADRILFCVQAKPELLQVGKVVLVNPQAIEAALKAGQIPVVAPIGIGDGHEKFNVNADWAATQIAIALNAKRLVFLTDQDGIWDENKKPMAKANPRRMEQLIEDGVIAGGMLTKVQAMMTALASGVGQVRVLHAGSASLLLKQENLGTLLTNVPHYNHSKRDVMHGRAS